MYKLGFFGVLLIIILGCSDNMPNSEGCGEKVIFSSAEFISTDNGVAFSNPVVEGDCLSITVSYSGCDDAIDFSLVTDGKVAYTLPPALRFDVKRGTNEGCKILFTKEVKFDLSEIRSLLNGADKARLSFPGVAYTWEL